MIEETLTPHEADLDEKMCQIVADFFSVYSSPVRIGIFCALREGARTVSELAEHTQASMQNVSQHLRLMRDKGAVTSQKRGQHVYYTIANPKFLIGVKMIRDGLLEGMQQQMKNVDLSNAENAGTT